MEFMNALLSFLHSDPVNDRQRIREQKGDRSPNTCDWILTNQLYVEWLSAQRSSILWLSGGPGKGKTMMSIFITDQREEVITKSQDTLIYYFCDNKDAHRNTVAGILGGFITQLLRQRPDLFEHIRKRFAERKTDIFTASDKLQSLSFILKDMVNSCSHSVTYCVLDGLDECDNESQSYFIKNLRDLVENGPSERILKLIVVSRDNSVIKTGLAQLPQIDLDSSELRSQVENNVEAFVAHKVQQLFQRWKVLHSELLEASRIQKDEVQRELLDRAEGTYLWVSLVYEELQKTSIVDLEDTLKGLPKGLDAIYARILRHIPKKRQEIAAQVLRKVVVAFRPLTVGELGAAVVSQPKGRLPADYVVKEYVRFCEPLLRIEDEHVNFVHLSAKEYLLRNSEELDQPIEYRIIEEEAHFELGNICFNYILANGPAFLEDKLPHFPRHPLLNYATVYWAEHYRDSSPVDFDLSISFFQDRSSERYNWWQTYYRLSDKYDQAPKGFSVLHLASYFGLSVLAQQYLLAPNCCLESIASKDESGRTPLSWAAGKGHEAVVRLLLEKGAELDSKDESGQTPLSWAAGSGHEAVVRLLLEKGAELDSKDASGRTPLSYAAWSGHEAVVRLLLEKGAELDSKDASGRTPLSWAAWSGHEVVVRLLLEKGAELESKDASGQTPLSYAAECGHEAVVRLLLEKGAELDSKDASGQTPLSWAAWSGHEAVVRLLLEKGAELESKDASGQTPLSWAAWSGHEAVVRLLLEKGAELESKDASGWTPLLWAAMSGHEAVVRLLLEKGAELESKDASGRTPLLWAAGNGHEAVVRLLLEKGAELESKDASGRTPLSRAAGDGHEAVVRLLLEKGAELDSKDESGRTPLSWATVKGHNTVVSLLAPLTQDS